MLRQRLQSLLAQTCAWEPGPRSGGAAAQVRSSAPGVRVKVVGELLQHLLAKFADVIVRRLPPLSKGSALQARLTTAHLGTSCARGPRHIWRSVGRIHCRWRSASVWNCELADLPNSAMLLSLCTELALSHTLFRLSGEQGCGTTSFSLEVEKTSWSRLAAP